MAATQDEVIFSSTGALDYRQLVASIDGIVWEADAQTMQFTFVSQQAIAVLGYPLDAWSLPNFWIEHMHPDDRSWAVPFCLQATQENRSHQFEYRMLTADGRTIWLRDIVTVIQEGGRPVTLCGVMVDITERKQAEAASRLAEQQLMTLVENLPDFIARFDRDGRILYLNAIAERAFNLLSIQAIGKTLQDLPAISSRQSHALTAAIQRVFVEKQPNQAEACFATPFGERYFEMRHIPEIDETGQVISVLGIARNITEQKLAEEERKANLWYLESMDKVNRTMQRTNDFEQMINELLQTMLTIFHCDRAWLLSSHDPTSVQWRPPLEQAQPAYPCPYDQAFAVLSYPTLLEIFALAQTVDGPLCFAPQSPYPIPALLKEHLQIQSTIAMAIYPKDDAPYLFGLHQCSSARVWNGQEQRLFQEIGHRLTDWVTSLLAYRRLQESELRYREVFENTSDVIGIVDVTTTGRFRLLDLNPAWEAVMGFERQQWVGKVLNELQYSVLTQSVLAHYQSCLQTKTAHQYDELLITATGEWHMHVTLVPICNAAGHVYRIVGVGRNVTDQKLAENELRASEARFRTFVEHATDAFFLHDDHAVILDVNQVACDALGYSRAELIGMTPADFDAKMTTATIRQLTAQLDQGDTVTFETLHRHHNGTVFPVELSIRPFWVEKDRFAVALARDITERKQTQTSLTLFRTLLDHTNDIIEVIDPATGIYLDVNEQACEIHGYSREEYLTLSVAAIDPLVAAELWPETMARLQVHGSYVYESVHRRKDGSLFPVEVNTTYIRLDRDYLVAIVRDITARKAAESALKLSEERYRILYEDNPTIYFTLDASGTILSVNPFGAAYLGYSAPALRGRPVLDLFYAEDRAAAQAHVAACLAHPGRVFHWLLRKVRKDGTVLWVEETARTAYDVDGALVLLVVCDDVTERKQTEQALIESHNLLNTIVEGTADAIFVKDLQGRYLLINQAGAQMVGRPVEAIIGQDDFTLYDPTVAERIRANDQLALSTEEAQLWEDTDRSTNTPRVYHTAKNVYRNAQGAVVGLIGISRDVTELKQLEEQFRQAQKMEALGRLAGGVAHDFNNLLTVITGYTQLLLRRFPTEERSRTVLLEIQKAGERAARLTGQLLAFSRKQLLQPQIVNLNQVLADLVHMLRRLIGEDIELIFTPTPDIGLAEIDPGQFEQTIINLAVNARDAMPHGGQLTIATHNVAFDAAYTERHPDLPPGRYVGVTVHDSGVGMDAVTKARIFEPFFTTKGPGKGTGLGLAMVYGFIKQSGGQIAVRSELGQGTTFTIHLPCVEAALVADAAEPRDANLLEGAETILLVEDEDSVRELVANVLSEHGYHVLEAGEPEAGLRLAASHAGPIHLLLTDMIMPQMNGHSLSQQLMTTRPNLKVLYMSGYTEDLIAHHELTGTGAAFLQKPFTIDTLLQKVRATVG